MIQSPLASGRFGSKHFFKAMCVKVINDFFFHQMALVKKTSSHTVLGPEATGIHRDTCGHSCFYARLVQKSQNHISAAWPTHSQKDKVSLLTHSGLFTLHQPVGWSSGSCGRRSEGEELSRSGRRNKEWFMACGHQTGYINTVRQDPRIVRRAESA